jgi:indolepyruvate ferredoxin oxidoreductase
MAMVEEAKGPAPEPLSETLDDLIARRVKDLTAYQDAAYGERYAQRIAAVRAAEKATNPDSECLTQAAARSLYKLMAYKDEYEVGRLYTDGRFAAAIGQQFGGDYKMKVQLSPPLFARPDPRTGRPKKYEFGAWIMPVFKLLAKLKGLRGTPLDIFGYSQERKDERAAISAFEGDLDRLIAGLRADNVALATSIASLPLDVRGYGPVKEEAVKKVTARAAVLWAKWPGEALRQAA